MDKDYIVECICAQKKNRAFFDCRARIVALKKLRENITLIKQDIISALKADLNKGEVESYMTEIGMTLGELNYMLRHCKSFSRAKRVKTSLLQFPAKSYSVPSPYGCALIMSPWNYPFMLSMEPMIDAIAAGNTVVLKPSRYAPNVSAVLDKLVKMTFSQDQVIVVLGGREENNFLLEQDFDYIFYTGSTSVGKIVMQKAAEKFIPVTLEMGGKSPCIVDSSADIALAAKRIVFGKLINAGQACVAPDFLYCARDIKDSLIEQIKKQIIAQYGENQIDNDDFPKMINKKQFDRVSRLIDAGRVLFGGNVDEDKLKIQPTLMESSFDSAEMNEEIFGPILPVVVFDSIDEAIEKINSGASPLALYIFTSDKSNAKKVMSACDFGGGCINDTIMQIASSHLAFGGLKQSGLGSYHGKAGFDTFTHYKSIIDKKTWMDVPVRYQPYTEGKYKIIKRFMK